MANCAAKHLCGMTGCPIINPQHHCMQCGGPTHSAAFCGVLWGDRDTSTILIEKDVCSERAQGLWNSDAAIMCHFCVDSLKNGHLKPSAQPIIALDDAPSTPTPSILTVDLLTPTPNLASDDLSPLKSIWECKKMTKKKVGAIDGWNCGWCMTDFKPVHATRATAHVLKLRNKGIVTCKAVIPNAYFHRYSELHKLKTDKRDASIRVKERISDGINKRQAISIHGSEEAASLVDLAEIIDIDAASTISSVTGTSSLPRWKKSRVSIM